MASTAIDETGGRAVEKSFRPSMESFHKRNNSVLSRVSESIGRAEIEAKEWTTSRNIKSIT